ncbi:MAG: hypothetical protein ACOY94_19920 [Bacillota bacterium]
MAVEIRKLAGGRVVGTNPDRLQIPLYADPPKVRVGTPGSLFGNVGLYVQISECSKLQFGVPEPTLARVVFREIDAEVYLVISPARAPGPDVYELKFQSSNGTKAPTVRGLKPLLEEAKIALRTHLWYECETEIVEDEDLGYAVAANWTNVATRPRREAEDDAAAAGRQPN